MSLALTNPETPGSKIIAELYDHGPRDRRRRKPAPEPVYFDLEESTAGRKKLILRDAKKSLFMNICDEPDMVDRLYVSGMSGCGKSTFIAQYITHFLEKFPDSIFGVNFPLPWDTNSPSTEE